MNANGRPMMSSAAWNTPGRSSTEPFPNNRSRIGNANRRDELNSRKRSLPLRPKSESGVSGVAGLPGVTPVTMDAADAGAGGTDATAVAGAMTATARLARQPPASARQRFRRIVLDCMNYLPGNQTGGAVISAASRLCAPAVEPASPLQGASAAGRRNG